LQILKPNNDINEEYKVNWLIKLVASGFYSGYIPFASGTFGSLLAFIIYLIPGFSHPLILSMFILVFFWIGVLVSNLMQGRYGYDPPEVVIDEMVGQWFTYLISAMFLFFIRFKIFQPEFDFSAKIIFGSTGFLLFRFFDIIKLQPAKYFDGKKNGYGIMLDDMFAGLYAGILSAVISHLIWFKVFAKIFQ
jgi:phosphatidylglycerophosphatase A